MLIGSQPQPLIVQGDPANTGIVLPVAFRRHIDRVSILILMPAELEPKQGNSRLQQEESSSLAAAWQQVAGGGAMVEMIEDTGTFS